MRLSWVKRRLLILKWSEVRENYHNKWILFEASEAYSKDGQRFVEELIIINVFSEGKDALKDYAEKHKRDKSREMYVYHTKNKELKIEERTRIGVRKYG